MKKILLFSLLALLWNDSTAQLPVECQPPVPPGTYVAFNCADACVLCDDGIDGFNGFYIPTFEGEFPPGFCAPEFHGPMWLGFVAGTSSVEFLFTPFLCQLGEGLQVGIYGTSDCQNFQQVSNCNPGVSDGESIVLSANNLSVGGTYFFVIDGNGGDVCEFSIDILNGSTVAPEVIGTPSINGPTTVCTGGIATYFVEGVGGAGYYNWTLDGATIGSDSSVDIVFPQTGSYTLCVTPGNSCEGDGTEACINVDAGPLPLQLIDETICEEDFPYTYQGFVFDTPGAYNFETYQNGCLQPILLVLEQFPSSGVTGLDVTICLGESYSIGGQVFFTEGVYDLALQDSNGCDSLIALNLTVAPPSFTNLGIVTSNQFLQVGNQVIDTYGDFEVLLSSAAGCDSIVAGFLNLSALDSVVVDTAICEGDTLFVRMDTLTESGIYSYQISDSLVYDSFLQINLTVLDSPDTLLLDTICQGEVIMIGDSVYNETGTYMQALQTSEGCDSTVNLELFVLQPMDTVMASICDGEIYTVGSSSYTTAGTYLDTLMGPTGCQSIVQTNLEVLPSPVTMLTEAICEGDTLVFAGQSLSMSGQYTDTLQAVNDCDSIVLLDLTAWPLQSTSITENICPGDSIDLGGMPFALPGDYTLTFTDTNGCDSTVNLTLNWLDEPSDTIVATICDGDSYLLGGSSYEQEGEYEEVFTAANGCDSTVTLILEVLPLDTTILNEQICEGESYPFAGSNYMDGGTYEAIFTSVETGCDSLVILNLIVLAPTITTLDTSICAGDTLFIGGMAFGQTGSYTVPLTNQFGCDSIVQASLTVNPAIVVAIDTAICAGESYEVGNSIYTESGQYTDTLLSIDGCDSIVLTGLIVLSVEVTEIDTTLCFGETFEIGPYTFTDTVNNFLQFTGANGCDSLVNLQLSYYDEIQLESVDIQNDLFGGLPDGSIAIEVAGGTPPYTYFWSNGRFGSFIDLLSPGRYFVLVTDANGCQTGFSFDVYFTIDVFPITMFTGPDDNSLKVYPNPFSDYLEVQLPFAPVESAALRMYDARGQEVHRMQMEVPKVSFHPDVPAGVYWLVAYLDGKIVNIEKVIKAKY